MLTMTRRCLTLVCVLVTLVLGACTTPQASQSSLSSQETSAEPSDAQASAQTPTQSSNQTSTMQFQNLPRLNGKATVELTIKGQVITIEVNGEDAPVTAGNFVDLVQRGVYDGTTFHRVVREPDPFVAQGGDPQSKNPSIPASRLGTGSFIDPATGKARYIPLEIKPVGATEPLYSQTFQQARVSQAPTLSHKRGAVAMARSEFPDSASSQFYVTLANHSFLDGNYAVFGEVTSGMEVVDQIQQGDGIESAKVVKGLENLQPGS